MSLKKIEKLKDIPAWHLCCGCGVCAYLYPKDIKMVDLPSSGRRPIFQDPENVAVDFSQGIQACPGIQLQHDEKLLKADDAIPSLLKEWGVVLEVWEAYSTDPEIRYKGSSGGAITALSLYCLEQEAMQGVLHVKADNEQPHLNISCISSDRSSLLSGVGSRYSPASPCENLSKIEKSKGLNVLVGKPCDVAGVYNVQKIKKGLKEKIGLTIACFCAGTPSTDGTTDMLRQMGVTNLGDIENMRYRGHGWPGRTKAKSKRNDNGIQYSNLSYEQSWGDILQKYRQWRCYICPDHTGEFADLSVGDPWYKKDDSESHGRSLILVRTKKGKKIFKSAVAKGYLIAEVKGYEILPASQPNLQKTRSRLWGQLFALKLLRVPCPEYSGFYLFHNWFKRLSFTKKIKSVLGTMKRVYVKKILTRTGTFDC